MTILSISSRPDDTGEQIRRRRYTADRMPPLDDGRRDPQLEPEGTSRRLPSTYGMTPDELYRYGQRLKAQGWADWELSAVLVDPRELQRELDTARETDRIVNPWMEATYA